MLHNDPPIFYRIIIGFYICNPHGHTKNILERMLQCYIWVSCNLYRKSLCCRYFLTIISRTVFFRSEFRHHLHHLPPLLFRQRFHHQRCLPTHPYLNCMHQAIPQVLLQWLSPLLVEQRYLLADIVNL